MDYDKALLFAYKYLARRARTQQELALCLEKKGFNRKIIQAIVNKLKKAGFVNDMEYAGNYIEREKDKGTGLLKMKMLLENKGIEDRVVEKSLKNFNITNKSQFSTAQKLVKLKLKQLGNEITAKVISNLEYFLARKGFEEHVIEEVLEKYKQDLI